MSRETPEPERGPHTHQTTLRHATPRRDSRARLGFDWKGTPLEQVYGPAGKARFVPISYKDQWSFVRFIDDEIGRIPGYR